MGNRRLVFIHGFLGNTSMWKPILPHLSKKDNVINLLEIPGHGENRLLPAEKTAESYCKNLLEQLSLREEESVFLIAHSMGGYLASTLVSMIPDQVRGLCLFHSKCSADHEQKIADRRRAIEAARENKNLYVRGMLTGTIAPENQELCAEPLQKMIVEGQSLSFEAIEAAQTVMIQRPDQMEAMKHRQFPLYYFLGDHDTSLPLSIMQEELAQLPGAVAHFSSNTGHMGHIEHKREAIDFLERILRADL